MLDLLLRRSGLSFVLQKETDMSTKKPVSKPDDLVESKIKGGEIELTEHELGHVAGGTFDGFLKIDGIEGESADSKHKGEIELTVRRPGR
jgi:hypothetical protein